MVALPDKSIIESLNIDTVERAIVFASLLLRQYLTTGSLNEAGDDALKLSINSSGTEEVSLKIDIAIPFSLYRFARTGGSIMNALLDYPEALPAKPLEIDYFVEPSIKEAPICPNYLNELPQTIESYFYYYASLLYASLTTDRNRIIRISPKGTSFRGAEVDVSVTLPLNSTKWALGHNLVECVNRVTDEYRTEYVYVSSDNTDTSMGNNSRVSNSSKVGN